MGSAVATQQKQGFSLSQSLSTANGSEVKGRGLRTMACPQHGLLGLLVWAQCR